MIVDLTKAATLNEVKILYNDLRDRVKPAEKVNQKADLVVLALDYEDLIFPVTSGTLCTYNGKLKVALQDIGEYEEFNPTDWNDTRIADILGDYVKNTNYADGNNYGIIKIGNGLSVNGVTGATNVDFAAESFIKLGGSSSKAIPPSRQHIATYYGLSKLAGVDLAGETVTVGIYPDSSKQAIQKLFGLDGILGDYESATASKAYAIGETFIYNGKRYRATAAIAQSDVIAPGTNCALDPLDGRYIKDTDYASTSKAGIIKVDGRYGLGMRDSPNQDGIKTYPAGENDLKVGTNYYRPVVPYFQHQSVFYGLSKLAGVDLASETVTVGTYPQPSKTAIQTMLGIEANIPLVETVTGATVSIAGMPNVRYICETAISELTITPPASGSIVVRFTAGSGCIVVLPQTVKLPEWFDISSLEAGTTYEIIITDGVYGGVMSWA